MTRTIYISKKSFINVKPGMLGIAIVFPESDINYIVFENGDYDGFSHEDTSRFLYDIQVPVKIPFEYTFKNVITLDWDYNLGVFDEIFRELREFVSNSPNLSLVTHTLKTTAMFNPKEQ